MIAALVQDHGYAYAEGGDEFIIMLPNTNTALAEAFVSMLLEQIRTTPFIVGSETVNITASGGISSSLNAEDVEACHDAASAAKREAKQQVIIARSSRRCEPDGDAAKRELRCGLGGGLPLLARRRWHFTT